jgi:hypothetical protein
LSRAGPSRLVRSRVGAVVGVLVAAMIASCFVSRKSSEFECETTAECTGGRVCDRGYCIAGPECPSDCNAGCDLVAKTCDIVCDQPGRCGSVDCPDGYACKITCTANNACGNISCDTGARSCEVICSAANACRDIDCGTGVGCDVTCGAVDACRDIDCGDSCGCEVSCPAGFCDTMTCPTAGSTSCVRVGTGECTTTVTGCSSCT